MVGGGRGGGLEQPCVGLSSFCSFPSYVFMPLRHIQIRITEKFTMSLVIFVIHSTLSISWSTPPLSSHDTPTASYINLRRITSPSLNNILTLLIHTLPPIKYFIPPSPEKIINDLDLYVYEEEFSNIYKCAPKIPLHTIL